MLNKVSAEAMVTMGEWELKSLITFNGSKARNRLRYMVRKYFCDGFFFCGQLFNLMSRSDESACFTGHNGEEANAVCHKSYRAAFLFPYPGFGIILH